MWTLILTISIIQYQKAGAAIDHVPGFNTKESCMVAGTAWLKQDHDGYDVPKRSALCVQL